MEGEVNAASSTTSTNDTSWCVTWQALSSVSPFCARTFPVLFQVLNSLPFV